MRYMVKTKINRYACDTFGVGSTIDIFVTEPMSVADLEEEWIMIRDDIAMKYQRSLTDDFERWNFYLFYVVEDIESLRRNLKFKIEHNTLSSRKIIISAKEIEGNVIPEYLIHKYLCYTIETENTVYGKPFVKNDKVVELIERNNHED